MSFFPLFSLPGTQGWTDLHNFPANNWEIMQGSPRLIHASWCGNGKWHSAPLGTLKAGASRRIRKADLTGVVPDEVTAFLSLDLRPLAARSEVLPNSDLPKVHLPAWQATIGLGTEFSNTSYQGNVDPCPSAGAMLSFAPFLQFEPGVKNHLLFLNLEKTPIQRSNQLEAYKADGTHLATFTVRNNAMNVIELNPCGFQGDDLPLFLCRGMAGVTLYFSCTGDGRFLSLEHTHPPASMVLHGQRFEMQRQIRNRWLERVSP